MTPMKETILLDAGRRSDGSMVQEEVHVEPLRPKRYRLLQSPGLVPGLAAGDVFDVIDDGKYEIVSRGNNLCIQIFFSEESLRSKLESETTSRLKIVGGRLDGKSARELVYTVPMSTGFAAVESVLRTVTSTFPGVEWYYGNVYDPKDGITPLNWWR